MWHYAAECLPEYVRGQLDGLVAKCRAIAAALEAEQKGAAGEKEMITNETG
jgi:hypothetical protein